LKRRHNTVAYAAIEKVLPVTNRTQTVFDFPALKRRKVQAEFTDGDISSDGGVLLPRQIDKRLV
jgi:hypothetical protein